MAGGSNIGPCLGTRYCTTATHSVRRKYLVWIVGRWFVHQHSATRRHTILHNFLSQKKWKQNVKEKEKYPKNNVKNYISRILSFRWIFIFEFVTQEIETRSPTASLNRVHDCALYSRDRKTGINMWLSWISRWFFKVRTSNFRWQIIT